MNIDTLYNCYLKNLNEYISFKSVSTDVSFKDESIKCVNWLKKLAEGYGAKTRIIECKVANPILVAKFEVSSEFETIMIYGHYDVQPGDAIDPSWYSDPFNLFEKDGKLYGRGVVDNKGQNLIHFEAIGELYKNKLLKKNVIFLIEGNEESGSLELPNILEQEKKNLECNKIIISDGQVIAGYPTIEMSLRGGGNIKVNLKTAKSNLHSGIYGGALPNAALELCKLLSKIKNPDNSIAIPGFYDGVPEISKELKENNIRLGEVSGDFKSHANVKSLLLEPNIDVYSQVGLRPTIEISGIKTGYIADGFANIVPANSEFRINVRLVGNQDPNKIRDLIVNFIKANTPDYVDLSFKYEDFNPPIVLKHGEERLEIIRKLLEKHFKKESFFKYCGGSIPIVEDLKSIFKTDPLLISFGNDDCNMHGVNENFDIDLIKASLGFSYEYFGT